MIYFYNRALIIGTTGMVGAEVLKACLASDNIKRVLTICRRKSGISHSKLKEVLHDNFHDFSSVQDELKEVDIVYYCLGVYQNQVSKEKFWEITVDYQEALLRSLEKSEKEITFCLFSAQGADPKERRPILFAKAKGRAERKLMESKLAKKYIFRPGFINPDNGSRSDIWVKLFQPVYRMLPFIGIDASDLGKVMVNVGLKGYDQLILENKDIRKVAKKIKLHR
jgi:nucleoside-diphosphate-sugar epimerase